MARPFPLDFAPGVVKTDAPYALRGRYTDADKVRFVKGKPQKWAGWQTLVGPLSGRVRALMAWDDFNDSRWLAAGTHLGLYIVASDGAVTKITPLRQSGTLGTDPVSTQSGSAQVTITHAAHGLTVGTFVTLTGATAVGGITVSGEYQVASVIDLNSYSVIHSAPASSTATGGGSSVAYGYEIAPGLPNVTQGVGYGTGTYGTGTWGTPRSSTSFTAYASQWALDKYGEFLLALFSGAHLYQWDPNTPGNRAVRVANCPTGNFMFVTNERYPVILGSNGDNMALAWPDQNNITVWTPSSTNTANERRLQKGSRLIAGANLQGTSNVVWSDDALYAMNFTGQRNTVYSTLLAGTGCGIIGPHAFAVVNGIVYWMGVYDLFAYGGGSVQPIPNSQDVRDWLYDRLDGKQNWKAVAHYSAQNNVVRWHVVVDGDLEPSLYVEVSLDDFSWSNGTLDRTAWAEKSGINPKVYAADPTGKIYLHEVGHDADGLPMAWHLESAPIDVNDGYSIMDIWGYVPNFERQSGDIDVVIRTWDMPQHTSPQEEQYTTIYPSQGIADLHVSGRQVSVRLEQNVLGGDFRLGLPMTEASTAGRRRGSR